MVIDLYLVWKDPVEPDCGGIVAVTQEPYDRALKPSTGFSRRANAWARLPETVDQDLASDPATVLEPDQQGFERSQLLRARRSAR